MQKTLTVDTGDLGTVGTAWDKGALTLFTGLSIRSFVVIVFLYLPPPPLLSSPLELNPRKSWLICKTYGPFERRGSL